MQAVPFERRRLRSAHLSQALELYLRAVGRSFHLSHVLVADHSGLLQANAGDHDECYALAAYAPMLDRAIDPATRARILETLVQYVPGAQPHRISLRRFDVFGETLYVCVIGDGGAGKEVALSRAVTGSRRILTQ